jgi:hypothetical protein
MSQQSVSGQNLQRVFWRHDQICITFRSDLQLTSTGRSNNASTILQRLNLEAQLQKLNQHLADRGINYTLSFLSEKDSPPGSAQPISSNVRQTASTFDIRPGVYIYGHAKPINTDFGQAQTTVAVCLDCMENASVAASQRVNQGQSLDHIATIVNEFNHGLDAFNGQQVPICAVSPAWLHGGTGIPEGCPITPPIPLEGSSCSFWHYRLPQLAPQELQSLQGEGVTVFILDTLPEREVVVEAARRVGDDNPLLLDVSNSITYNYNFLSRSIEELPGSGLVSAGKDVYGHHEIMKLTDHGLFIAGVIHDIAPKAQIEVIRVLDDYAVGDLNMLLHALQYIRNRMTQGGDLYQKPVVINMSLVFPPKEKAQALGLDVSVGGPNNDPYACVYRSLQSLVGLGAVIAASSGNDADLRQNPEGKRPPANFPAAFANPPYSLDNVVPVGAVDKYGRATSYSCYPGPLGVGTYGGELPKVEPPQPDPNVSPVITVTDAVRGIYSSETYPVLISPDSSVPVPEYPAPNHRAWAYWVGTSFATPVISAVAARILEMRAKGAPIPNVRDAIRAASGTNMTTWDRLDPANGVPAGNASGPVILANQTCINEGENEEDSGEEVVEVLA